MTVTYWTHSANDSANKRSINAFQYKDTERQDNTLLSTYGVPSI